MEVGREALEVVGARSADPLHATSTRAVNRGRPNVFIPHQSQIERSDRSTHAPTLYVVGMHES